jgi:RNA polymerase sigma factor (sigma-70 family)
MEISDEALVLACRRGDTASWEILVQRYQRLIYTIPRRSGLSEDQAADVFQLTFARFLEKINDIEQPGRISAWLATTAKRETWRMSRRARTMEPLPGANDDSDESTELPDNAPLPDEVILRLEQQHTVRVAVASLDERCRTLLTLLFYEKEPLSYAEIADTLGVSEGSIGPTRARCLKKLQRLLTEKDD